MSDREEVLRRLGESPRGTMDRVAPPPRSSRNDPETTQGIWERFSERLEALGGKVIEPSDLEALAGKPVWIDQDAMPLVAGSPWLLAEDVWEAEAGITLADQGIAETGSLLLSAGAGRARLASLGPPIHVAILRKENLVGTLDEAIGKLTSRTCVLISGPSRTADIEGVLVRGVHGPKELWVLPI